MHLGTDQVWAMFSKDLYFTPRSKQLLGWSLELGEWLLELCLFAMEQFLFHKIVVWLAQCQWQFALCDESIYTRQRRNEITMILIHLHEWHCSHCNGFRCGAAASICVNDLSRWSVICFFFVFKSVADRLSACVPTAWVSRIGQQGRLVSLWCSLGCSIAFIRAPDASFMRQGVS